MNRQNTAYLTVILSLFLAIIFLIIPAGADTVIIHTNDIHGRLTDNIGYDGLSSYIAERTAAGDEIVLLDAGDATHGKVEVNSFKGESVINIMNILQYDAMAVGNHEFEYGAEQLLKLRDKAEFPFLAANVFFEDTGKKVFADSAIITTSDYKIGVFGLSTPETKQKILAGKTDNIVFAGGGKLYEIAQQQVDSLKKEGCNLIICLGHLGTDEESVPNTSKDVAEHVTGIDLFIDGHSHTELPGGLLVKDTLIVSTGEHLQNIGVVTLNKDKMTAELISGSDKKDETITALCNSYIESSAKILSSTVVGETKVYLEAEKTPGCRTGEVSIGDLAADALLYAAQQMGYKPDCALINGGSIRESIPVGKITELEVYYAFPFINTLSVASVPGSILLNSIEKNTAFTPSAEGGFPQVSGIDYTINTAKQYVEGEINRVTINSINGKLFNPDEVYVVATTDFITTGGDKYADFTKCVSENTEVRLTTLIGTFVSEGLNGVVDERYAKPAGRIHIIDETRDEHSEDLPATAAASPVSMTAVFAGLAAGLVFARIHRLSK